jgi:signal transduction histidine kinase
MRLAYTVTFVTISTIGALVASRRPENPIGWLVSAAGLAVVFDILAGDYATSVALAPAGMHPPGAALAGWLVNLLNLNYALIVPTLLLFPDGRLPSARWRPALWLATASAATAGAGLALLPGLLGGAPSTVNSTGVSGAGGAPALLRDVGTAGLLVCIVLAAAALVLRFRRAWGDERQQLKWVAYAGVVWILGLVGSFVAPRAWAPVVQVVYILLLAGFVLALGVAILKHRLYDVDRVITRTLAYGALAVVITAVYVGVVAGLGVFAGTRGEPNLGLSLLATALVAVLFQPLRERLQRVANRLVYGQRASPYEVLAGFSRRLAGALSVDEVLPRLAEAAARGVGAARAEVRVAVPGGHDQAAAWPDDGVAASFERVVPVHHQGELVGKIAVTERQGRPLAGAEHALLRDLAAQVGPALSNVRLALALRTQADELRASRQRLVAAQDAERRRLERDLHDGAQQDLVAVAVNARLAREVLRTVPAEAEGLLDEVVAQAGMALATLRDVARGIFPPALVDQGLAAAVEAHLAKARWPAGLETEGAVAGARYAPAVEAAVYFCVREAVQNVAKHAPGAPATVRLAAVDGGLSFTVADRGPGFDPADAHGGTGLQGMADRLAAVGGAIELRSQPGQGTVVSGRVPATPATTRAR